MELLPNLRAGATPFFGTDSVPWGWRERAAAIAADMRPEKLDLGAGMIRLADGTLPTFEAVGRARTALAVERPQLEYLPPLGLSEFRSSIEQLVLGPLPQGRHAVTAQTVGAAYALRLAADCLKRLGTETVLLSAESWADHKRIFEHAGLRVQSFPYLAADGGGIDVAKMLAALEVAPSRSMVVLQAACHNPTGYDPDHKAWHAIFDTIARRGLLPFFDVAYAGFGEGLAQDLWALRECLARGLDLLVATSCCKTFGIYNERVGALSAVVSDREVAERLASQLKIDIQATYSNPPRSGAALVAKVLQDAALHTLWREELDTLRGDLAHRRNLLVTALRCEGAGEELLRIASQRGIFAWSGLGREACDRLARDFSIYLPSNGRICLGAAPEARLGGLARALVAVSATPNLDNVSLPPLP